MLGTARSDGLDEGVGGRRDELREEGRQLLLGGCVPLLDQVV
jgi:hypothetical protein